MVKRKLYRGWMSREENHCLFETIRESLEIGGIITDAYGKEWKIEVIF